MVIRTETRDDYDKVFQVNMACEVIDGELDKIKGELKYPETFF